MTIKTQADTIDLQRIGNIVSVVLDKMLTSYDYCERNRLSQSNRLDQKGFYKDGSD
jgi:hypothetical protein